MAVMSDTRSRQIDFTGAMLDLYRRILQEVGHRASSFFDMVNTQGGYETAISLIYALHPSSCYTILHGRQRLDLAVEALVLRPEWSDMFNDEDRQRCYIRLQISEFQFPSHYWHP
jgi:hypothetical protein